jgi:hypothetical protein
MMLPVIGFTLLGLNHWCSQRSSTGCWRRID